MKTIIPLNTTNMANWVVAIVSHLPELQYNSQKASIEIDIPARPFLTVFLRTFEKSHLPTTVWRLFYMYVSVCLSDSFNFWNIGPEIVEHGAIKYN